MKRSTLVVVAPLVAVSVAVCSIPVVTITAEWMWNLPDLHAGLNRDLPFLLYLFSPYAFLATMSLIPAGRTWSVVMCASCLLLAASGLLAQLNVLPVRGCYGLGWLFLPMVQWWGCLAAILGAGVAQVISLSIQDVFTRHRAG
jgi:hypothetical protein